MTLSSYIAHDLQQRVLQGNVDADSLTLVALGEHYGVSFTPIRRAIDDLVERRLLLRQENGRVVPNPDVRNVRPMAPPEELDTRAPVPQGEDWDEVLGDEVVRQSLMGDRAFLREEVTAARFGIGRTLLRQVFHRLAGAGLLEHVPRRGWQVRPFQQEDLVAFLEVREVLELKAMDLARPAVDVDALREFLAGNRGPCGEELDNRLHGYFIRLAGNRYIADFFAREGAYYTKVFDLAAPETEVVGEMAAQHRRVLERAVEGDWRGAKEAMAEHIRAQLPVVSRLIEKVRREAREASA